MTVDDYIAAQPPERQVVLTAVREAILAAMPGAVETMAYQMPAYRVGKRVVLYFAGWAKHIALYPTAAEFPGGLEQEAAPYRTSKGTLQFPLKSPMPLDLIARIAACRAGG
jgi:uncharacterized protein YdhG (YjbR/CyaY superfamily)